MTQVFEALLVGDKDLFIRPSWFMAADGLMEQGARSSAAMSLTLISPNIPASAPKRLIKDCTYCQRGD